MNDKVTTNSKTKKFKKILLRILAGIVVFILLLAIALQLPFVQTAIARYATGRLNEQFGTQIYIDKVAITVFGSVKLKDVLILDHHNDTLASAKKLQTNILSFNAITESHLEFGTLDAELLYFHMKTYKGETDSNLNVFVKKLDNGKPGSGKFRMMADDLYVKNGRYRLTNENAVTPRILDFQELNGHLKNFLIKAADVSADIKELALLDHRGLRVKNLTAGFMYTKTKMYLQDAELATAQSALKGNITLTYTMEDMKDFLNKVKFTFEVERASVASNELNIFFNEFGPNQKYYLSTTLTGPLNNFVLKDLKLIDDSQSEIMGTVNFRNLFDKTGPGFYMDGNFSRISSAYANLRQIMPRIFEKSLPEILDRLGRVDLNGHVHLTRQNLETQLNVVSQLGSGVADLHIDDYNKPDNATYNGNVKLTAFDIGALLSQKNIGKTTLDVTVNGKGFNEKSLNTQIKGNVSSFMFNRYNYRNIALNGKLKWPYYEGNLEINDPNLLMGFDGLVDVSRKFNNYDFHARVDYADLAMLKLVRSDTLSIFKGELLFEATGNGINDIAGTLQMSQLSYQNSLDSYYFEDFFVESSFDEKNVRTISVNSTDIVEGRVTGVFDINQLPKLVQNAVGSLYTNYSPYKVKEGQFLDFNFSIYNKIIEIVLPDIEVGQNTRLNGRINADKGEFVFEFNSPQIVAYNNRFSNIAIDINNKNPLYNAYVSIDSVNTKAYKVSEFNLINVTQNDTLYLRSEFKGGSNAKDYFNLNLYHTIDKNNNSVVGFKKSEISFKDYLWFINEDQERDNKIVFNKKLTDFTIDKITMSHNAQKVELAGIMRDSTYKDLKLTFDDVELNKVTPTLDSLNFYGNIDGEISLKQDHKIFEPASSLKIDSLRMNEFVLGDLNMEVSGDKSLRKFNVNTSISKNNEQAFSTTGIIEVVNGQTLLSLDAIFTEFDLSPLTVFLKSVFPEIRGRATGRAAIVGNAAMPEIDGILYLKGGGVKVGYLNTDYNFEENTTVSLTEQEIYFSNTHLIDSKYKTSGRLNGVVKHNLFKDWALDLKITSDRILVLDTQDSDEALYYGTAFINGEASISGQVSSLYIDVEAESEKGTFIKIPINNTDAVSSSSTSYIHFISPDEKEKRGTVAVQSGKTYKGIEMKFDLNVTPDANLEVIIDKNTGHSLRATGNGILLLDINTQGKFNMWGDYQVQQGEYIFKYGSLIDKKFSVKPGGYINWEGDPTRARLNLEAVYTTQANPSILLETPTFSRSIPVQVVIQLNGILTAPEPEFTINFPTVSSVMKSDLEYKLNDLSTRQTQALSLLSTGTFISPTNAGNVVYAPFLESAGNLFNDLFSDEDSKVKLGFNYVQADRNPYVETNSQLGLTLQSQISERITINGQLGVPVGGVNQSAIVGNVEVQLRINDDGTLKARVFNRENDINFLGEGIGYTQGVGLTYEVDFNTFNELIWKVFKNAKAAQTDDNAGSNEIPDSELSPEFIKFAESRNRKKTTAPQIDDSQAPPPTD
ncbi:translocation/assembly module TamB domain-containing protein [Flavobacterium rhizosphaerae]|uniref:Translocation/assembly module TamB domain-containing protein n=1 Tax=Flavobacterium rhizosphaerae TaxID=3163298 RepID=A0ABW8YZ15_9FLAO